MFLSVRCDLILNGLMLNGWVPYGRILVSKWQILDANSDLLRELSDLVGCNHHLLLKCNLLMMMMMTMMTHPDTSGDLIWNCGGRLSKKYLIMYQ